MDAERPLVTVVTPSYNQGRFIAATIESVLSQDYRHVEYIVMDGGSTDETAAVVARYAGRLTFVSERDRGQSHAINKGFRRARGEIVAWLNSDDIFLPGAITAAVDALLANPSAAAVYGEGFQIDESGAVISRFAHTQPFNLWRFVNVSDFILQQTVFFRRSVFDEIGFLDEDLHYGLDWELLMRVGLRYPLVYVPHDMGAIREYATAKSFAGGMRRAAELTRILRRHTAKRFPAGMFVYGLPSCERALNARIERTLRGPLAPIGRRLCRRVTGVTHGVVGRILRDAQGWYGDGWAARRARFLFPPPRGRAWRFAVSLPAWSRLSRQDVTFHAGGRLFARASFGVGEHALTIGPPGDAHGPIEVEVRARRSFRAAAPRDKRDLAYVLRSFAYVD